MTRGTFEELENRCKKLRNKRVLKILLLSLLFLIFIVFLVFTTEFDKNQKIEPRKTKYIKTDKTAVNKAQKREFGYKTKKDIKKEPIKVEKKKIVKKTTKIVQKPKKIKQKKDIKVLYLKPKIYMDNTVEKKQKVHNAKEKLVKKGIIKKVQKKSDAIKKKHKKSNFKIEVKQVKKRDKKPVNIYDEALMSAKNSFSEKKYIKCIYWAKKASKLNSSKAEPWILYAKAKYKLGKKREAIESLRTYLNYFYSKDALDLLKNYEGAKK